MPPNSICFNLTMLDELTSQTGKFSQFMTVEPLITKFSYFWQRRPVQLVTKYAVEWLIVRHSHECTGKMTGMPSPPLATSLTIQSTGGHRWKTWRWYANPTSQFQFRLIWLHILYKENCMWYRGHLLGAYCCWFKLSIREEIMLLAVAIRTRVHNSVERTDKRNVIEALRDNNALKHSN
jgi:hypothetical protein